MGVRLKDYQEEALHKMKNGCILNGGVGSGKSITSIAYYFRKNGGELTPYRKMSKLQSLYIITTARKRDTKEWEGELSNFLLRNGEPTSDTDNVKVVIDSWNNIAKYVDVKNAFFIFDEQRVVGYGTWTKSFLKITANNQWILLSATPGDCWMDYIPVFIANGFYKNKTEFLRRHVKYSRYCTSYPKIEGYVDTGRLIRLRNSILVDMDFDRPTIRHDIAIEVMYDRFMYKQIMKERYNYEKDQPIENASELCYELRKLINKDDDRIHQVKKIFNEKKRVIIFYNFDYELEILLNTNYGDNVEVAQWNGHKHQEIPLSNEWVYLVQYTAGAEGWNCIKTDTIIFYSQNYSYKIMEQSSGRIDRMNTPYVNLYYYHLKSKAPIDLAIDKAIRNKKKFNECKFVN